MRHGRHLPRIRLIERPSAIRNAAERQLLVYASRLLEVVEFDSPALTFVMDVLPPSRRGALLAEAKKGTREPPRRKRMAPWIAQGGTRDATDVARSLATAGLPLRRRSHAMTGEGSSGEPPYWPKHSEGHSRTGLRTCPRRPKCEC